MHKSLVLLLLSIATLMMIDPSGLAAGVRPTRLRCEYLSDPLGIDVLKPRFTWILDEKGIPGQEGILHPEASPADGVIQSACQILVAPSLEDLRAGTNLLWDSGKIPSTGNGQHAYDGQPLGSGDACWWKVRIWTVSIGGPSAAPSEWSAPARYTIGPVRPSDWTAKWISAESTSPNGQQATDEQDDSQDQSSPDLAFEKRFLLEQTPHSALAQVASIGYHELEINGTKAGDAVLTPNISELSQRARYVTYDLAPLLRKGENNIRIVANSGWAGFPRFENRRLPIVRCQVDLFAPDRSKTRISTDASWKSVRTGNRRLQPWVQPRYGSDWQQEQVEPAITRVVDPAVKISASRAEPNRLMEELKPVTIERLENGWRIDFGRSFTGWLDLPLVGTAGAVVQLDISEREAKQVSYNQTCHLVLSAAGRGRFRHQFNYTAGRWLTIRGPVTKPTKARAWLVHTDYRRQTRFHSSNELLNRIHDTTMWTFRCLSLGGYVVDCPHRERLGYGGDAHATIPTGLAHYGLGAFYTKWLEDWRDVQSENGDIPHTAPTYEGGGGPAWSGVVIQLPWRMYVHYGDKRVLEENWPMVERWLAFIDTKVRDGLLRHYGSSEWGFLGDWVPPGRKQPKGARVDDRSTLFFNNCYWVWSLQTAARIADVLGKEDESARLNEKAVQARRTVHSTFWNPERGVYVNGEQPYLAFPLLVGVTPNGLQDQVARKLEETIHVTDKGHINAGIHGHALLLDYLTRAGRSDLIFEMVQQRTYPSWGHMLQEGATTIWEQWDGEESRCHSSFLGVGAWFIRGLGGIRPDPARPGYEHFFIQPQICGDLTHCEVTYDSIRGPIESRWRIEGDNRLKLTVSIPPGTRATVVLPGEDRTSGHEVGSGRHAFGTVLP